jgi:hypothetical protein
LVTLANFSILLSPYGFLPPVLLTLANLSDRQIGYGHLYGGRKPKELKKIDKLAKVTNTGGRNP